MKRWNRGVRRFVAAFAFAVASFAALQRPATAETIKLATLAPQGSVWDQSIRRLADRWKRETAGRVELRIYSGGVAGDESDALRKTRIGQFQGLAISVAGLTEIDPAFNVFQLPLYFESWEELDFVLAKLRPVLEERLAAKGFVLLHWGHGGWVRLFSRSEIRTLDDLRAQKLFVWAGDDATVQSWKKNGFQPVPLAATDILLGFQTKMIDVVPTTPILALSAQWYRQTPTMMDLGLAPLVGGVLVTKKAWDAISPADRKLLEAAAHDAEVELGREVPEQDRGAVGQMKQRGLKVIELTPEERKPWRAEARKFVETMGGRAPAEILAATEAAVAEFRARTGAGAAN